MPLSFSCGNMSPVAAALSCISSTLREEKKVANGYAQPSPYIEGEEEGKKKIMGVVGAFT